MHQFDGMRRKIVLPFILVVNTLLITGVFVSQLFAQNEQSRSLLTTSEIARRVTPTVVTIETPTGYGSGVIVDPSGVVVTNLHVIQGALKVELSLHNGDIYDDVTVVDFDERRDLVLLKIKAFNVRYATLGDSDEIEVGEDVVLVGSPQGLDLTVSEGVISAIRESGRGYRLIQTSAPASPGSSGGGMFNQYGELIGIVTSQKSTGQNLNFAVPVNFVRGLISSEATMSLSELNARARSTSERTGERTENASSDDNLDTSDTNRLRAIIESIETFEDLDDILDMEDAGDGLWVVTYKDLDNLSNVVIGIKLITDEFEESLVWVRSVLPDPDYDLTTTQFQKLLELNVSLNIAKVVRDDDGSINTMAEIELRTVDSIGLLRSIYAVADAADQVMELLNRQTYQGTALNRTSQSGESTLDLLDAKIVIRYAPTVWKEVPQNVIDDSLPFDTMYGHHTGEVFIAIEANRIEIPVDKIADLAVNDIQEAVPNAEIVRRGFRTVNGVECAFWEHTATSDGIDFTYLSHGCSNSNGTVRIVGWTTPNLIDEHRSTIEYFVAGLDVAVP